jgi:hypothetical protein
MRCRNLPVRAFGLASGVLLVLFAQYPVERRFGRQPLPFVRKVRHYLGRRPARILETVGDFEHSVPLVVAQGSRGLEVLGVEMRNEKIGFAGIEFLIPSSVFVRTGIKGEALVAEVVSE